MSDKRESRIRDRIQEAAQNTAYPVDAFWFVLQALSCPEKPHTQARHVDAPELCWRLRDHAVATFGLGAGQQLERWGIRSTNDFGIIVYSLIDHGLAAKTEQDAIDDFHGVFEFDDVFCADQRADTNRQLQWRLSTLFIVTTLASIAFAGAAKLGVNGAFRALLSSWLGLIGVWCLCLGIADRSRGWILVVCMGVGFLAIGVGGFLVLIL